MYLFTNTTATSCYMIINVGKSLLAAGDGAMLLAAGDGAMLYWQLVMEPG